MGKYRDLIAVLAIGAVCWLLPRPQNVEFVLTWAIFYLFYLFITMRNSTTAIIEHLQLEIAKLQGREQP